MKKPIIGVIPLWDDEKESIWMLPGYMEGIERANGLPVILPLTADKSLLEQICYTVDGILFTGGQDIAPEMYGEEKEKHCGPACYKRDKMETLLFSKAVLNMNKPALGICRSIQLFNVILGGTLYQDIPGHSQKPPYDKPFHNVKILPDTPLFKLIGESEIAVNSYHHQGIRRLSEQLVIMAEAEDGLPEAVYMPDKKFAWAVQWHPEYSLRDENSLKLFNAFIKSCIS